MNKKVFFIFLFLAPLLFFNKSLTTFFTQDDFILISHFSQNGFGENLINVFGKPEVTHFRPIHNLFFMISGMFFEKNYIAYHLIVLLIHVISGFLIFEIVLKLLKRKSVAFASSFLYLINPSHFVSLNWISGSATVLGFTLFLTCFYLLLNGKKMFSVIFLFLSFLASEAMVTGAVIIILWVLLFEKFEREKKLLLTIIFVTIGFIFLRLSFLTPATTYEAYKTDFSLKILDISRYYILRTIGTGESDNLKVLKIFLAALVLLAALFLTRIKKKFDKKIIIFSLFVAFFGLFPFVLLPEHLSPNYMNLPIFGFALFLGVILNHIKKTLRFMLILLISIIYFLSISETYKDNWVIKNSIISKTYIEKVESLNLTNGSTLIFHDNYISDSKTAYILLGGGKAIDFWFKNNDFKPCFVFYQTCTMTGLDKYYAFD